MTPVRARVTGGGDPPELVAADAVALVPEGWPTGARGVRVELLERVDLPLLAIWAMAAPTPFVQPLRKAMKPI